MTTNRNCILSLLLISNSLFLLHCEAQNLHCSFDAIYNFGDSISDTGNLIRESPLGPSLSYAKYPYGVTAFKEPTGRCSDGYLIINFIASVFDLPYLNPYLAKDAEFNKGVNFAVAGATALNASYMREMGVFQMYTHSSLHVQLDWFTIHLKSICSTNTECETKLKKALFMMGEIGGNYYNYAFMSDKPIEEVIGLVPHTVQTIKDAVERAIGLGAVQIVVPGNFPIGCMPFYLTGSRDIGHASYDETECLKDFNSLAMFHNNKLQQALEELRKENPDAVILYADYYNAFLSILNNATNLGFEKGAEFKACCGIGGDYANRMCGAEGVPSCDHPGERLSWDGIHLTQNAYKHIAEWLIHDLLPNCNALSGFKAIK